MNALIRRFFSAESLVPQHRRLGDLPGDREGYRNISRIAVPSVSEMVLSSLIGSMDAMMVGILGKNAYPVLTRIEDAVQGVVGMSKDMIVVRSGVVAVANLVANQFQLLAQGVPLTELPRQLKIAKQKAGIPESERCRMERFEVVRHT